MMGNYQAASLQVSGPFKAAKGLDAAHRLRDRLKTPARMAFAFATPDYLPHIAELCDTLRVDGHIQDIVGCTAAGYIEGKNEFESGSGFSVIAIQGEFGDPVALNESDFPTAVSPNAWITLANPFVFPIEDFINSSNLQSPRVNIVGGLASGGGAETTAVFLNGNTVDAAAVSVLGNTSIVPVLSQGCRPIGEPFTVTRADQNVIYALGGQPAYRALENAFETLTDEEKSNARGNLFAGLAGSEYVHEFHSGDFLVKNIIGADPTSGAVVIAGIPRVGQTLQYQLRNSSAALDDLGRAYEPARLAKRTAYGSLLFSCLGRGEKFFGMANRDASELSESIGDKPIAGCFCNGEIGPVRSLNALHTYTAAAAVFIEKSS